MSPIRRASDYSTGEDLDVRARRILLQPRHRGTQEIHLILGSFAALLVSTRSISTDSTHRLIAPIPSCSTGSLAALHPRRGTPVGRPVSWYLESLVCGRWRNPISKARGREPVLRSVAWATLMVALLQFASRDAAGRPMQMSTSLPAAQAIVDGNN